MDIVVDVFFNEIFIGWVIWVVFEVIVENNVMFFEVIIGLVIG